MSKFILAEEVETLDYNFEPYAGTGTVPEPSAMQIQAFRKVLAEMVQDAMPEVTGMEDPRFMEAVTTWLGRDSSEMDEKVMHAVADLCTNQPSFDDLSSLPYRARQAFVGWLTGMFLVPEALMPATRN
jgi:hypothetical protein